ncbi:hypothetical protein HWV62_16758 [Athelia sp. TMB]|nr:hypothetical protein HWV62_16758 [Athelia sp. TMB]
MIAACTSLAGTPARIPLKTLWTSPNFRSNFRKCVSLVDEITLVVAIHTLLYILYVLPDHVFVCLILVFGFCLHDNFNEILEPFDFHKLLSEKPTKIAETIHSNSQQEEDEEITLAASPCIPLLVVIFPPFYFLYILGWRYIIIVGTCHLVIFATYNLQLSDYRLVYMLFYYYCHLLKKANALYNGHTRHSSSPPVHTEVTIPQLESWASRTLMPTSSKNTAQRDGRRVSVPTKSRKLPWRRRIVPDTSSSSRPDPVLARATPSPDFASNAANIDHTLNAPLASLPSLPLQEHRATESANALQVEKQKEEILILRRERDALSIEVAAFEAREAERRAREDAELDECYERIGRELDHAGPQGQGLLFPIDIMRGVSMRPSKE